MEGTTSFALVDTSPSIATVKGSLAKPIQSTGKVLFQPRNEICHHIRDLCRGCDVFVERRKMQHPTRAQVGREKVKLDLMRASAPQDQ